METKISLGRMNHPVWLKSFGSAQAVEYVTAAAVASFLTSEAPLGLLGKDDVTTCKEALSFSAKPGCCGFVISVSVVSGAIFYLKLLQVD